MRFFAIISSVISMLKDGLHHVIPKRSTAPAKLHHKSMDWEHKNPSRQTTPPKTREVKKSDPEGNKAKKTKTSDLEGNEKRKTKMSDPEGNEAKKTKTNNLDIKNTK